MVLRQAALCQVYIIGNNPVCLSSIDGLAYWDGDRFPVLTTCTVRKRKARGKSLSARDNAGKNTQTIKDVEVTNPYRKEQLQEIYDRMIQEGCHVFWRQDKRHAGKFMIMRRMDTTGMEARSDTTRIREYMHAIKGDYL